VRLNFYKSGQNVKKQAAKVKQMFPAKNLLFTL
jgi:hypothetical protein